MVGMNHTGKSSLIKSLFIALGARPTGDLDQWSDDTAVVVEISIGDQDYFVVNQMSQRALFSSDGTIKDVATNATEWGTIFTELVGYNLVLTNTRDQSPVSADARTFFLPFYINQDGSWLSTWSTFVGLQQYRQPIQSVLEYFTRVKPAEYYELSSRKTIRQTTLSGLRGEERLVKDIRERVAKTVPLDGPKTVPEAFNQDIDRLTDEMTKLNAQQEQARNALVKEKELLDSLKLQIDMARHALSHYDHDAEYLQKDTHEVLVCPTCHAEHTKTFMDILRHAEDARILRSLIAQLEKDARKATEIYNASRAKLRDLDDRYSAVSDILETRRGDVRLDDVLRGMGAETALAAFAAELGDLKQKIDQLVLEIEGIDGQLAALTDAKRTRGILKRFRSSYEAALTSLNMPPVDTKRMKLSSRPDLSGSGGPRSILAYYSALWKTCVEDDGSYALPVVIDSPQQQGQDASNLPVIIKYIADDLPSKMQVILAVETPTTYKFDKTVTLEHPYQLLRPDEFSEVSDFVRPFLDRMSSRLVERPETTTDPTVS
ncbi:hypothetical protein HFO24_06950 [Rhizobium laguerreae]|uniref:hypothetical protein n=1 Tax=Rhizobium laguerreae TaxID=1076926 RepID=UPI001C916E62|nr:hypothetical protein [Rhizobium laguerreae]MBY3181409.1 hypothetical protein [Rhizobium laguerreae]